MTAQLLFHFDKGKMLCIEQAEQALSGKEMHFLFWTNT